MGPRLVSGGARVRACWTAEQQWELQGRQGWSWRPGTPQMGLHVMGLWMTSLRRQQIAMPRGRPQLPGALPVVNGTWGMDQRPSVRTAQPPADTGGWLVLPSLFSSQGQIKGWGWGRGCPHPVAWTPLPQDEKWKAQPALGHPLPSLSVCWGRSWSC